MLYTLSDARTKVAPFVGSGSSSTTLIDMKINDAIERLLDNRDWECLRRQVRITCIGNTFALPFNAEKILWCDVDGSPVSVYGQGYQYLSSGPGDLDYRISGSVFKDLVDLGDGWPTQYEAPKKFTVSGVDVTAGQYTLAAFTTAPGETDKTIKIYGADASGNEIPSGETIPIQVWGTVAEGTWDASFQQSTSEFSSISRVIKPVTTGYVDLYAVYAASGLMFRLARYHPSQLIPQFRRFRIGNAALGTNGIQSSIANYNSALGSGPTTTSDATYGSTSVVLAIVRLRHVPLTDAADILPIDSLQALRLAVMAITAEDEKDFVLAKATWADAVAAMSGRESSNTMTKGTPVILDTGYRTSLGRKMRRNILI